MTAAKDADTLAYFYVRNATDAMGRDTSVTLGNGKDEERIFDRATGYLESIQAGTLPGTPNIQDLSFTYDEVGNLETRTNSLIGKTETLNYDALDRLTSSVVSTGGTTVTMTYSAAGRLNSKTGLGTYTYTRGSCGGGPFAPKSVSGVTYCYDASGRMTSRGADTFTWYSYDLPKKLANGTKSTEFSYGVDRERYKQVLKTGTTVDATIYYVGRLYEKETAGSTTTHRHHVMVGERMVATVSRVGTTNTPQYLHQDHQGSVVEVTSSTGSLVQSLAYDPWGLRRNATNWLPLANPFGGTELTERGYTGHEHLDTVKYIHMSGRVQDPTLGIFLSPDPIVQSPFNSQGFNRYSYVRNNPATFIDPSGYSLKRFLKRWVGPLFGGGIAEGAGAGLWGGFAGFIAATAVNIILDRHTDQSSAHFVQQAPANNTNAQRHAPTGIGPVVGTGVPSSGASTAAEPFFGTPEAARREAYRQLPYGSDVNVEWGVEISRERVNGQYRYYVGTPVPGRAESVTYDGRIFRNPDDGKIVNPDGREIVELAHTHLFPRRVNWEGNSTGRTRRAEGAETFSGGGRGLDSDIGIAEQLQIPVSMRIGDSLKIYDPKVDRAEPRTGGGYRNAKGRTICNEGCFE